MDTLTSFPTQHPPRATKVLVFRVIPRAGATPITFSSSDPVRSLQNAELHAETLRLCGFVDAYVHVGVRS